MATVNDTTETAAPPSDTKTCLTCDASISLLSTSTRPALMAGYSTSPTVLASRPAIVTDMSTRERVGVWERENVWERGSL